MALEKSQKAAAEAERRASQAVSKETDEMKVRARCLRSPTVV